jgi:uncharacterized membrane protein YbhN (UPF0104 family)
MLSPIAGHAICAGLCTADYLARAWRIRLLAGGLGYRLRFRDAMAVNLIGDAACSLTPLRIAGEPARLGVMASAGVPPTATLVAITYEVLTAWPVIMICAGLLLWRYAPEWWENAAPGLIGSVREAWPWVVALALISLAIWVWVRRSAPASGHRWRPVKRMIVHWRRMPWPLLLATAPLTVINLSARVAVLPVLAATLPHAPPPGLVWVGSLALLYSQLVLPTPSGAGVVELGFLGGAAGDLGNGEAALLVVWRFYTTGVGLVIGVLLAAHRLGWRALRGWIGVRRREQPYRGGSGDAKARGDQQQ